MVVSVMIATFSIRNRIDVSETKFALQLVLGIPFFQYPQSDRCERNFQDVLHEFNVLQLSVSAIGSM